MPESSKWTKKSIVQHLSVGALEANTVRTPSQVADELERWVAEADVNSFNISYSLKPGTFVDVVEMLLPELRRSGLFWADYAVPGGTFREKSYPMDGQKGPLEGPVASKYRWKVGVKKEDVVIPK
jgi:hypothetical protein